jgi:PAS domain S-box-containing protein
MTDILQHGVVPGNLLDWSVLDQIQASVILTDVHGVITGWNRHAEQLYGWTSEEALGRTLLDLLVRPGDDAVVRDALETLNRGERWEGELPMRSREGSSLTAFVSLAPLLDTRGKPIGSVGVSVDMSERRRQERRLTAQYAVTNALSLADGLADAAPEILQAVCEALDWDLGGVWMIDDQAKVLRLVTLWHRSGLDLAHFEELCREMEFQPGVGLPGRVWRSGTPTWIPDIGRDANFPRALAAAQAGFRSAVAFPVVARGDVMGVLEFFSPEIRQPDPDLLAMVGAIGSQIGQFVERKQAEEALRASEARKGAILESAIDAVVAMDANGLITEFNPSAEAMFGHKRRDVLGKPMAETLIPPSLRERHYQGMARYLATGEAPILGKRIELRALRADGTEFPVELTVTRVDLPGPPLFTAYIRDIEPRQEAEVAAARLASIVESSGDVIIGKTLDGIIQSWNQGAERVYGYRPEEAIGRNISMLVPAGFPNDVPDIMASIRAGEVVHKEAVRRRKDGQVIDVEITVSPIRNPAGEIMGASTVARDITERKLAEARLRFLAEASRLLAGTLDYAGTLEKLAGLAVPDFAQWCIAYGVQPDGSIKRLAMAHAGTAIATAAREIQGFRMVPEAEVGVPQVIRSGTSTLVTEASPELLAADVDDPHGLQSLLEPIDIRSWICVPLVARGRTLGAISFVCAGPGRHYDADDLRLAEELARHAAIAVDNSLLYEAERDARRATEEVARQVTLLQSLTAALSEALTTEKVAEVVVDRGVESLGAVAGMVALLTDHGKQLEIVRSVGYRQELLDKWRTFSVAGAYPLSEAVRTGEPILLENVPARTERFPGLGPAGPDVPDHAVACVPLVLEGRAVGGLVLSFGEPRPFGERDRAVLLALGRQCAQALERARLFAAEREARAEAERTREQLSFLAEASAVLSSSLDYDKTLARVARLAVPRLADWCSVDVASEDGTFRQLAVAHVDPTKVRLARQFRRANPPRPDDPSGVPAVVRTGRAELYPDISEELIASATDDPKVRKAIADLGLRSAMIVPLPGRGRTVGAITFVWAESGRRYGPSELALAEDLARRAGQAIENARLYEERDHIAHTLQQSLLPPELPDIPGMELAARYLPAGEGNEVGGDFYDVFETGAGAWGIAIGDVCGKGAVAAAVMALARYTLRAAAMREDRPSLILQVLNEAVLRQGTDGRFITVCYVRVRPGERNARLTVSCGGHPLPAIIRAHGALEFSGEPGTLLGVFPDPTLGDQVVDLGPGDALVLYTDGVTEIPGNPFLGERRLHRVLRDSVGLDAKAIAERVETEVLRRGRRTPRDDMAVLIMRVTP